MGSQFNNLGSITRVSLKLVKMMTLLVLSALVLAVLSEDMVAPHGYGGLPYHAPYGGYPYHAPFAYGGPGKYVAHNPLPYGGYGKYGHHGPKGYAPYLPYGPKGHALAYGGYGGHYGPGYGYGGIKHVPAAYGGQVGYPHPIHNSHGRQIGGEDLHESHVVHDQLPQVSDQFPIVSDQEANSEDMFLGYGYGGYAGHHGYGYGGYGGYPHIYGGYGGYPHKYGGYGGFKGKGKGKTGNP